MCVADERVILQRQRHGSVCGVQAVLAARQWLWIERVCLVGFLFRVVYVITDTLDAFLHLIDLSLLVRW
jgi:hypothetical protein